MLSLCYVLGCSPTSYCTLLHLLGTIIVWICCVAYRTSVASSVNITSAPAVHDKTSPVWMRNCWLYEWHMSTSTGPPREMPACIALISSTVLPDLLQHSRPLTRTSVGNAQCLVRMGQMEAMCAYSRRPELYRRRHHSHCPINIRLHCSVTVPSVPALHSSSS